MHYKLYSYELSDESGRVPLADDQYKLFNDAKARDAAGEYTRFRGKKDAVLMHVRNYDHNFIGLIGRHAIEREVTAYNEALDETRTIIEVDDDYPHVPFVCFPQSK